MEKVYTVPEGKIKDYVDGTFRNNTPEEYVRQTIERRLVEEHRYKPIQIAVEFGLKIGSGRPRADLVVWDEKAEKVQENIKIIIECKKEKITPSAAKDGIGQLKSYMSACLNCEWGMWTNGIQKFVFRKVPDKSTSEFKFEDYNDIPTANANIKEIDRPTRAGLKRAVENNLLFVFRTCHDYIYANDGLHKDKAFFEFLKIIFCKIEDERNTRSQYLKFYATSKERRNHDGQLTVKNRITEIFENVKRHYKKIFPANDEILLTPRSLASVVGELQKYTLLDTNIDIKGKAYEEIVGANLRGDRGEFFTPRNIMKMVVDMIEPQIGETVLDSSCGTGGFLVIAMTHVINQLKKDFENIYGSRKDRSQNISDELQKEISDNAKKFFGFDLNPDLVKATKMNMVMNNDGSGNILQANSLLPPHEWRRDFKFQIADALGIDSENLRDEKSIALFDIVVTNPPFGSKIPIDDKNILKQFELAHIWTFDAENNEWIMTDNFQSSVPPEILFVERCTQFLKPGGRMGIILPDSILGSPGLGYIRTWILKNCKILASFDLHADTFQPHNGTQTSVLILQKKLPNETFNDYEIFMAMVEKVGHDKRGNQIFKRDDDGNEILDDKGEKIPDDETAAVAKTYLDWKKKLPATSQVKFCAIKLSEVIARGCRLEAGVYDVDAMNARQFILSGKFPVTTINKLADSYVCGRFKRIWLKKSDLPIYQPSSIVDIYPKPDGYISAITATDIDALRVHAGQILLTCSGTIGKVAFVSKTLDDKIFSHDLLRITPKNNFDAGYIYAFLKSKIGNQILLTNSYGAVITHIEPEHLENIPVPDAPPLLKQKIHSLIVQSYNLRDESNALIDAATKILIEELQLPPLEDFDNPKIFSVKASNLFGRFDASYHLPLVGKITQHLKNHAAELLTIGDSRISNAVILPGRFKRVYVDEGHGRIFIGGKQILELDPSNKKYLSIVHHEERISKQLELQENMILITCSETIGKVALVPKHWENWTASQHIIRIVPASVEIAGYLNIFLASDYGRELITRNTYGAVVDEIDDKQVKQIPIPMLKNSFAQDKINSLALSANEKRYTAYLLEQEALKIFETEIL